MWHLAQLKSIGPLVTASGLVAQNPRNLQSQ